MVIPLILSLLLGLVSRDGAVLSCLRLLGRAGEPFLMLEVCNSSLSSAGQFLEPFIWGCSREGGGRRCCLSLERSPKQ